MRFVLTEKREMRKVTGEDEELFLVRGAALSEAVKKTVRVKELLERREVPSVNEAVKQKNLSRSAYYKYKDDVFPFYDAIQARVVMLNIIVRNRIGILAELLSIVAAVGGNIMTINQGVAHKGSAVITIALETDHLTKSLAELLAELRAQEDVRVVEVLGQAA